MVHLNTVTSQIPYKSSTHPAHEGAGHFINYNSQIPPSLHLTRAGVGWGVVLIGALGGTSKLSLEEIDVRRRGVRAQGALGGTSKLSLEEIDVRRRA